MSYVIRDVQCTEYQGMFQVIIQDMVLEMKSNAPQSLHYVNIKLGGIYLFGTGYDAYTLRSCGQVQRSSEFETPSVVYNAFVEQHWMATSAQRGTGKSSCCKSGAGTSFDR